MKTLLVLAQHPEIPDALRAALDPGRYRIVHRLNLEEAEPFLGRGMADGCMVDLSDADVRGMWILERLCQRMAGPVMVFVGGLPWEWEEEAYLKGVTHVMVKPVKPRLLNALLDRYWTGPAQPRTDPVAVPHPMPAPGPAGAVAVRGAERGLKALEVLRDLSTVLSHSLQAEALMQQFLLHLREILGVNRAVIFLRRPDTGTGEKANGLESRRLRSACAMGLPHGLLEHFELSFESGIGGYLFRHGRILRVESAVVVGDRGMAKEFELLGAQVAIPILDRETLVGVAAFDGRVTGDALGNGELELIFHLLEQLGLAVRNIWLHDQLAANHSMLAGILRELSSACLVVNRDLTVVHANQKAMSFFVKPGRRGAQLEFSDLPHAIGSKVYQVLQTGTGPVPFRYRSEDERARLFQVTVVPFQKETAALPTSVLLVVEDLTGMEHLKALEIEAANLRLVRTMADRLAHEVGNSLVPLATHQQLLKEKYKDPEFRASLEVALADGVKRISRLASQMRFLARDSVAVRDAFPLAQLLEEAHGEAQKYHSGKATRLKCDPGSQPIILSGDRAALKHALTEVMLNALQANPEEAKVGVRFRARSDAEGGNWVEIEIQDTGPGVEPERTREVLEPFITNRNVGLGLGLTVSRKIIETHRGHLSVLPSENGHSGGIQITLPLDAKAAG